MSFWAAFARLAALELHVAQDGVISCC